MSAEFRITLPTADYGPWCKPFDNTISDQDVMNETRSAIKNMFFISIQRRKVKINSIASRLSVT